MSPLETIDDLFHSVLVRFFSIPTRQALHGTVTFGQMRLLSVLNLRGSATSGELARALGVSGSTATEVADRLAAGGYLSRTRPAGDRRRVVLALRPKGRRVLERCAQQRRERFRQLFRALSPAEIREMARALETLNRLLETRKGAGS